MDRLQMDQMLREADRPVEWVRCLACLDLVEKDNWDWHPSECDGLGYEDVP